MLERVCWVIVGGRKGVKDPNRRGAGKVEALRTHSISE